MDLLATTDPVDARTLRDFDDVLAPHKDWAKFVTPMVDAQRQVLAARTAELMARRRQFVEDSGPRKGKRHILGGRADVRAVVHVAAPAAIKHNAAIKPSHSRLIAAG